MGLKSSFLIGCPSIYWCCHTSLTYYVLSRSKEGKDGRELLGVYNRYTLEGIFRGV